MNSETGMTTWYHLQCCRLPVSHRMRSNVHNVRWNSALSQKYIFVCGFYRRKRKHSLHSLRFPSCFFWSVSVRGWLNPVLEAISMLQRLTAHLWPQTKAKVSGEPSWGEHPGEKVRQCVAMTGGIITSVFLVGAWIGGAVNAQIITTGTQSST